MSPRYPVRNRLLRNRSQVYVSNDKRLKLNYDYAKHVIVTFQNSAAAYVQPILKPVDPEEDDASDYYTVIQHPMDLSTMLEELEDGYYQNITDFTDSFKQMFSNCFKYNCPSSDVYKMGVDFQAAFNKLWDRKHDWIEPQISHGPFYGDLVDDSGVGILYQVSDDDRIEAISETDEATPKDDETSNDDLLSMLDGNPVSDGELSTNDDTIQDGTTEADRKLFSNITGDETSEDDLPPVTRRRHLRKKSNLISNHTPKTPEHRYRARKKDGSKHHTAIADTATVINTNQKRPLDTTESNAQDHVDSVEQSTEVHSSPIQKQSVPAEQATKKSCLNIFQDHFGDSFQESHTEQPQPEPKQPQSAQCALPSASDPDPNPLKTMLASIISTQIDTTTSKINNNVSGQYTQHLKLLEQLCSSNEKYEAFYGEWKTKAMDKVSQMQVQEILVRGVEQEVGLALVDTVTEQARVFCEQMTSDATAFSNTFGGEEGK